MTNHENMTPEQVIEYKREIDSWDQYKCCSEWRFAKSGRPHTGGNKELSDYFAARFKATGGFTPEISKSLGW